MSWFYFSSDDKKNIEKIIKYLTRSANIYNFSSINDRLGEFYERQKNFDSAIYWYKRSLADKNNLGMTLKNLGKIYYFGLGVEKNFEKAFENLKESVAWHNHEEIRMLADVYLKKNSAENPAEFIKLLEEILEIIPRLLQKNI